MCYEPLVMRHSDFYNHVTGEIYEGSRFIGSFYKSHDELSASSNLEDFFVVPCGMCLDCALNQSREWAVRICHEALYHPSCSFLTLTYSDEHLPSDLSLQKRDYQLFMKRLRKRFPYTHFRYFYVGEYGDRTHRPHYHAALFGSNFKDSREVYTKTSKGFCLYKSDLLNEIWGKGFVVIGDLTFGSASYVSSYLMKKRGASKDAYLSEREYRDYKKILSSIDRLDTSDSFEPAFLDHYKDVYGKFKPLAPFSQSSNRPGIGYQFVYEHHKQLLGHGFVRMNNGYKCPLPRYYSKIIKQMIIDDPLLLRALDNRVADNVQRILSSSFYTDLPTYFENLERRREYRVEVTNRIERHN